MECSTPIMTKILVTNGGIDCQKWQSTDYETVIGNATKARAFLVWYVFDRTINLRSRYF